ncbi:MAG: glycosyltransferase family 39 protein [Blastocatellia bacterium]
MLYHCLASFPPLTPEMKTSGVSPSRSQSGLEKSDTAQAHPANPFNISILFSLLVLAGVFLLHRKTDAARIPGLITSFFLSMFGERLLGASSLGQSLAGTCVAALMVCSWLGLGALMVGLDRLLKIETGTASEKGNFATQFAQQCAFGAGIWALLWCIWGLTGLYRTWMAVASLVAGTLLFAWAAVSHLRDRNSARVRPTINSRGYMIVTRLMILAVVVLAMITALTPPVIKDALMYHLSLPAAWIAAGGFTDVQGNIFNYLAHGVEMHSVWALLLGGMISRQTGEAASGAVLFAFFPLTLLLIYGWASEIVTKKSHATLAVAMFAAVPTAYQVAGSGYVDLALTLFLTLYVRNLTRWWKTGSGESLLFTGLALGFALSVKLNAVYALLSFVLLMLFRLRTLSAVSDVAGTKRVLVGAIKVLLIAGGLASPWYIHSWLKTGSPIFPFYTHILRATVAGWDQTQSGMLQQFMTLYGGAHKSFVDYLLAPFNVSLLAQAELSDYFDGVIGFGFLIGAIILVTAYRKKLFDVDLHIACGFAVIWFGCWLFSSQQARYLLSMLPTLAVAIVTATERLSPKVAGKSEQSESEDKPGLLAWALTGAVFCGFLVICAWFMSMNPVRVVLGGETRTEWLRRWLDYYPYYETVNGQLPTNAKVWLINMRRDSYHIERAFFSDYTFEDYTISKWVSEVGDVRQLRERARAMGVTHILIRHDVLLDYNRSPIVDPRRPESENRRKMQLLSDFLTAGTRVLKQDQKFMLVELPAA